MNDATATAEVIDTAEEFKPIGTASYSVEDNKLRIYPFARLDRETYDRVCAAGYKWAKFQECFVAPMWTPQREDLALELCGEIDDEDYSATERAADRAERFGGYRDKRATEAGASADKYEAGPQAFGHQNRERAERQARRHDRKRTYAVSQWSKAEYWQERTAGVISNALHKSDPRTRRGRIKVLEAEQRRMSDRTDEYGKRWQAHYENRLTYERAMLANEGGTVADVEMVPGGWIRSTGRTGSIMKDAPVGWVQIHAVTRSTVTKKVTSVKVMGAVGYRDPKPGLVSVNVERLGEDSYRAPTADELAEFLERSSQMKAEKKASTPKAPPLINPTDADAEKLQAEWNARVKAAHEKAGRSSEFKLSEVWRMTQAEYSARSKGSYGPCETSDITEWLMIRRQSAMGSDLAGRVTVFKVRTGSPGGFNFSAPQRVVVITDKPQKPLPWLQVQIARSNQPQADDLRERLGELADEMQGCGGWKDKMSEAGRQLFEDAIYLGWCYSASLTQFGFTDAGLAEFKEWQASNSGAGILATV